MAKQFVTWDWVVFGAMLGISAFIGVFYAVKSHYSTVADTTGEFLMGGRKLHLLPVSVSILVSFMSAITILGAPAEMYTAGTLYFLYTLGLILACVLSATIFVPLFYPLKLTSSFEYLEGRFQSKVAKLTGALIMIVQQILYMGIAAYAPSTALEAGHLVHDDDNDTQTDPYEWVPAEHLDPNPDISIGEPVMLNPCSYDAVEKVLKISDKVLKTPSTSNVYERSIKEEVNRYRMRLRKLGYLSNDRSSENVHTSVTGELLDRELHAFETQMNANLQSFIENVDKPDFTPVFTTESQRSTFYSIERKTKKGCCSWSEAAKIVAMTTIFSVVYFLQDFRKKISENTVTGFPTWATIITIGCVSTFYTFLGGMKAVIWTDVFQSTIMIAGLLAIVIQGAFRVGSFNDVWKINKDWGRIEFWEADPDPTVRHSVWSLIIGTAVTWTGAFGVSQASVQRYCAVETFQKARMSVLINIIGSIVLMVLACLAGVVMFAYYAQSGCDPLSANEVSNANQMIPYFVMEVLGYPGLPGLFVSCLFSGALSTMSSCLNALAAVCWEDMFKPLIGEKVSESTKTWITRVLVFVFGGAGIGFAFMAQNLGGTVLQASLSFTGAASGPLLGVFLLGGLFPRANAAGCVVGGILGLVMSMWVSIGAYSLPKTGYALDFPIENCTLPEVFDNATDSSSFITLSAVQHLYTVSYLWFSSIGTTTTVIVGLFISLCTAPFFPKQDVDPIYLIPLFDRLFCCFPESWRRLCRCGYDFREPEELVIEKENEISEKSAALSSTKTVDDTHNNRRPNLEYKNGVSGLAYRPSKSEFVYDNRAYNRGDKGDMQIVFTSNV